MKSAILLSGGMDSAALAAWKMPPVAITIDYGQKSAVGEIRASIEIAKTLSIQHHIISVDCSSLGSGDLAGSPTVAVAPCREWWPFRNQLLITLAAMKVISLDVDLLLFGSVLGDSQHVDGSAHFFDSMNKTLSMQEGGLQVAAPASHLSTVELIRRSGISRAILGWCHSCHTNQYACGRCRGCHKYNSVLQLLHEGGKDAFADT